MSETPHHDTDPVWPTLALASLFVILCGIRLTTLSAPYFDEVHYLPAAREILDGGDYINREHPLFGKTIMAAGIGLFGDNPWGWRIFPLLAGAITLVASMRAMWHATRTRFATLAFGVLLASGFMLLVQSRIAMLDIFMAAFLALAAWQFAAAIREPETGRWRLALTGIAIGCALAFEVSARMGLCAQEDPSRVRAHLSAMGMKTDLADIDGELPGADALLDLMGQGAVTLNDARYLVLDEADEMLLRGKDTFAVSSRVS